MSPSQLGFQTSIPNPAAARAFSPTYSDAEASAACRTVHIAAARTALGGNPAAATKSHTATAASRFFSRCPRLKSGSHHSARLTSAKTIPVWSPDTANRCDNPLREYAVRSSGVTPRRSPAAMASTTAAAPALIGSRESLSTALRCRPACRPGSRSRSVRSAIHRVPA